MAAKEKYPQVPTFMYGHSMGGNKVLNYVLRYRPQIQATIVTSPWLRLAFAPPQSQLMLGKVMRAVYPAFTLDGGFEENTLSRDPAVDAAYYNDPYVHTKVTSQLFFDCYEAGFWALEHAHEFPTPLLLAHGDGDKITDYTASVEFAQKAPNCTFKQWAGLYHETHNEPEKDEVIAYNLSWLDSQLP
ncbi:MAG TPA: alpha/beta fold hydrolase [Anaerolineae bacterium]|nr:alpha/beta fold hydrolase [Anaerolineae bacterium]